MRSGIYTITNNRNNKIYVGRSTNVYRRLKEHKNNLDNNRHCNHYLQDAYNLEPTRFMFEILDLYPEELIVDMEQYWLNMTNASNRLYGYCLEKSAYQNKGGRLSEETKEKLRKSRIGKKQSIDTIEKRSAKNRGQKRPNQAEKMRNNWNKVASKMGWHNMTEEVKDLVREKIGKATRERYQKSKKITP